MRVMGRRGLFRGQRRPKEPVVWDRSIGTSTVTAVDTVAAIALFTPTSVVSGNLDERLTVLRAVLDVLATYQVVAGAGGNGIALQTSEGLYVGKVTDTTFRDPSLSAAADQRTDWLWLSQRPSSLTVPSASSLFANQPQDLKTGAPIINVKAKRKLEQEDQLIYVAKTSRSDDGTTALSTIKVLYRVMTSVLYQRTMRR